MILSAHQCNFFPWGSYFEKIKASDKFIILTQCQFEKNNYQNRFNIGEKWYSMGVNNSIQAIKDKQYSAPFEDFDRIKRRLPQYKTLLSSFDDCISSSVAKTNILIIKRICLLLGIETQIATDSPTDKTSTGRLAEICRENAADTYLCGESGGNYMNFDTFKHWGIKVQQFSNPAESKKPILEILHGIK